LYPVVSVVELLECGSDRVESESLLDKDPAHNTSPDMIANFEETAECKGNWLKASVAQDGKFTVTNGRNGFSKSYTAR
jgi:hypothetical protein